MTPKDLFNIILKIFGLFFLREVLFIIPQLLSIIPYFANTDDFSGGIFNDSGGILSFMLTLIAIAFYIFIVYQLLFKTNRIIEKLKLNRGFDQQKFSFNISSSLILAIALIVIGGIILIDKVPLLFRNIFSYFQERKLSHGMVRPNLSYIISVCL